MYSRIAAVVRKEFAHIAGDRNTLALLLLLPGLQFLLFGYAINTVVEHVPMVVFDGAGDADSRGLVTALQNSGYFDVRGYLDNADSANAAISTGQAKVALIIPQDFGNQLMRGGRGLAQLLVDGSDPNTTQAALFAAGLIASVRSADVMGAVAARLGQAPLLGGIELRPVVLFNPGMLSAVFIIPGLIGVVLQQETLTLTAQAIVRERESGTLEQLNVTPVRPWELMLGKCIPYAVVAMGTVAVTLGLARIVFGVVVAGSVTLLFVLSLIFLLGSLGTGLLISAISHSEMQARQLTDVFLLPTLLLTGFIFPRESMPLPIQDLGLVIPLTYYLQVLRGIILKGVGLEVLWTYLVPQAVYAVVVFAASAYLFRKRTD